MNNNFQIGQTVYHRQIYDHKEPLKIVGIRQSELELEGDYSGGTHNITQRCWMPLEGVSRVYNYKYKRECRDRAVLIQELNKPATDLSQGIKSQTILELLHMVFVLTTDITLNKEY